MEVKITHFDQVKFSIQLRSHTILCDQPVENGGEDWWHDAPGVAARVVRFLRGLLCRAIS